MELLAAPAETMTSAPSWAEDAPPLRCTSPLIPFVPAAPPVAKTTDPLLPELVVPELKARVPLTPEVPASDEATATAPEEVAVPKPDCNKI